MNNPALTRVLDKARVTAAQRKNVGHPYADALLKERVEEAEALLALLASTGLFCGHGRRPEEPCIECSAEVALNADVCVSLKQREET